MTAEKFMVLRALVLRIKALRDDGWTYKDIDIMENLPRYFAYRFMNSKFAKFVLR